LKEKPIRENKNRRCLTMRGAGIEAAIKNQCVGARAYLLSVGLACLPQRSAQWQQRRRGRRHSMPANLSRRAMDESSRC